MKRRFQALAKKVANSTLWPRKRKVSAIDPKLVGLIDAVNSGFYLANDELAPGLKIQADDTVLDVGCGGGLATHYCARQGAHVVFTDIDRHKVDSLREMLSSTSARKVEPIVSDTNPLPLTNEYASVVLAMEVLEHTRAPEKILEELVRVGKSGARYLITVPDARSENVQEDLAPFGYFEEPNHVQVYGKQDFLDLVQGAGLEVERHMTWGFYWTMWWCLKWCEDQSEIAGETLSLIDSPSSESLTAWATLWHSLLINPKASILVKTLNDALPKSQGVIARKPEG